MEDFLLAVWRTTSQHLEIEQSIDRVARLLAPVLPASAVIVRRFDFQRAAVETVTSGMCGDGGERPAAVRSQGSIEQFNALLAWCRSGRLLIGDRPSDRALVDLLVPAGLAGTWLVGPLFRADQPLGALVLLAAPGQSFAPEEHHLFERLLEPLAVALANDLRMHELARLREASEADKRALLSRLDRDGVTEGVVGSDSGLRPVMERVTQVAPTDAPVLILGETGTGKEVLARTIHSQSRRASGPVVRVNCGALPPGLIDSELFGHERGSFTGAVNVRQGWFERADGGTLFLDEIGELPLDAQVRLLRILQDGTFERVGAHKALSVDVRIVAATHRDLQEMVGRGTFREDLWYRISVFPIHLPPLRERVEDIPALAAHFAGRAGKRLGGSPLVPSRPDMELLMSYAWPGNVRELASVIERAAILGGGKQLHIAAALGRGNDWQSVNDWQPVNGGATNGWTRADRAPEIATLDTVMARHIEVALRITEGRIEGPRGAARRLGINPHTLRARMKKAGIDWRRYRPKPHADS